MRPEELNYLLAAEGEFQLSLTPVDREMRSAEFVRTLFDLKARRHLIDGYLRQGAAKAAPAPEPEPQPAGRSWELLEAVNRRRFIEHAIAFGDAAAAIELSPSWLGLRTLSRIAEYPLQDRDAFREALLHAYRHGGPLMSSGLTPNRIVELFRLAAFPKPAMPPLILYRGYHLGPDSLGAHRRHRRTWAADAQRPLHPSYGLSWTDDPETARQYGLQRAGVRDEAYVVSVWAEPEAVVAWLPDRQGADFILDPTKIPQPKRMWHGRPKRVVEDRGYLCPI